MNSPRYTDIRDYLRVLRDQRWIVLAIVVLFTVTTLVVSLRQHKFYEASASVEFRSANDDVSALGGAVIVSQTPEQRAATSAQTLVSVKVAERVRRKLKTRTPASTLLSYVTAQPEARTNYVVVQAHALDPVDAAAIANAFADSSVELTTEDTRKTYTERAKALQKENKKLPKGPQAAYTKSANVDRINKLQTLARFAEPAAVAVRAKPDDRPVDPRPVRNTLLALLVALTLGVVVAFARDSLDRRFKSSHEVTDTLRLPLVGHVRDDVLGRSAISANGRPALSAEELEGFRILRTNVDFLDVDKPVKTLLVTSALPEEGKSTVATGLACTYASAGRRVLLVECDLRRPTMSKRFGIAESPGLSDYLAGNAEPKDVLRTVAISALSGGADVGPAIACIVAGTPTPRPAELLGSQRFEKFLEQVAGVYDIVLLDSCPLLSVSDTLGLVPRVDGVLLCVRTTKTTRNQTAAAKSALEHFPGRPTGIVLTGLRAGDDADYGYYSYAYAYGSDS